MPLSQKDRFKLAGTNPPPLAIKNGWIKNLVLTESNRTDLLNFASWDIQFGKLPLINRELDWESGGRLESIWLSELPIGNKIAICGWDVARGRHCPMLELTENNTESLGTWIEWMGDPIQIPPQSILFAVVTGTEEVINPIYLALMGGSY